MRQGPPDEQERQAGDGAGDRHTPVWRAESEDVSLIGLIVAVLRNRRPVVLFPLVLTVVVIAVSLVLPASFTASAAFHSQAEESPLQQFSGLTSQLGIQLPLGETGQSPEFYADLLTSRHLLRATVETRFELDAGEPREGTLVELYDAEGDSYALRRKDAVETLEEDLSVSVRTETGVVEFRVTSPWAELSQEIAERMLALVNEFNLERRQTRAQAERSFLEGRLEEAKEELRTAEDSLRLFLERNRGFENSPALRFTEQRLQRRVELRQGVVVNLAQAYEQARIEEVRNTPVITVVDPAVLPVEEDSRDLVLRGILALVVGSLFGVGWAVGREFFRDARRQEPGAYDELGRVWREATAAVRRVWRRLRGALPGTGG